MKRKFPHYLSANSEILGVESSDSPLVLKLWAHAAVLHWVEKRKDQSISMQFLNVSIQEMLLSNTQF